MGGANPRGRPAGSRPLVCRPRTDLRGYSRPANLLLIDRRPLGTSLELAGYAAWVRRQPLLASLGTPVWTTVQTQPNEALRQQLVALDPGVPPPRRSRRSRSGCSATRPWPPAAGGWCLPPIRRWTPPTPTRGSGP